MNPLDGLILSTSASFTNGSKIDLRSRLWQPFVLAQKYSPRLNMSSEDLKTIGPYLDERSTENQTVPEAHPGHRLSKKLA